MIWLIALAAASEGAEGGTHHEGGIPVHDLSVAAVSLLVFVVVLVVVARKPVTDALAARAFNIRKSMDEANTSRQAAEKSFAEVEAKLAALDQQLVDMQRQAEREAEAETARLAEKAQADAARIQEVAERTIREESEQVRRSLREEAVKLAVGLARNKAAHLMTVEDQRRFAREFLDTVKEAR